MITSPIAVNGGNMPNKTKINESNGCEQSYPPVSSSSLSSPPSYSSSCSSSSSNGHNTQGYTAAIPIPFNRSMTKDDHLYRHCINNNNNVNEVHYMDIVAESPSETALIIFLDFAKEGHYSELLSSINNLRKQGQFCDIRLMVGEHELAAHRAVLAASSPYLFDFLTRMEESTETRPIYKLKEVSYEGFHYLLEYMYTGRLSVPLNDVPVVYESAMVLKMEAAIHACAEFLSRHLSASNCFAIRRFSRDNDFRVSIDKFIRSNMEEIMSSKSFFGMTDLQVEVVGLDEIISDETMERRLFSLVLGWAKNNLNDLKPKLERLTAQVNVLYLSHDNTLIDCADVEDTALSSDDDVIIDYKKMARRSRSKLVPNGRPAQPSEGLHAFHKFSLNPEEALSVADREWSIIATSKTSENAYLAIAVLDGQLIAVSAHVRPVPIVTFAESNGETTVAAPDSPAANNAPSAFAYDTSPAARKTSIAPLEWMTKARCAMGAVNLNNELIVFGGYDRGECLNNVEAFNLKENKWHELPPMIATRGRFGAAVVDGCVYTCGGSDGFKELSCAERYDPSTLKWNPVASMLKERSSHGVTTLNGRLYCIGGCEGQRSVSSCEVYDPAINKWSSIAPLNVARSQTSVCALNNQLFAIGGTDQWNTLNTVEVYDPTEDVWMLSSNLNIARRGAAVDVVNGTMVLTGGSDGMQSLTSSEILDLNNNVWVMGPQMTIARANLSVVTLGSRLFAVGGFSGKKFLSSLEWLDMEGMEWMAHVPRLRRADGSQEEVNGSS